MPNPVLLRRLVGRLAPYVPVTPDSLPGLDLWWKAESFTGQADNTPIGGAGLTWIDTKNAVAASQAGAGKPVYRTNQVNSLPAIVFASASSQYLDFATRAFTNFTVLAVFRTDAALTTTVNPVMGGTSGTAGRRTFVTGKTGATPTLTPGVTDDAAGSFTASASFSGLSATGPSWHLFTWKRTAGVVSFSLNRISYKGTTGGAAAGAFGMSQIGRGAAVYLPGAIAELVVFASALSDAQIASLWEDYFAAKYALFPLVMGSDDFSASIVGGLDGQFTFRGYSAGTTKTGWVARNVWDVAFLETFDTGIDGNPLNGFVSPGMNNAAFVARTE